MEDESCLDGCGSNFWIPCLQHARSCVLRNEAGAARDLTTMKIGYKILEDTLVLLGLPRKNT